MEGAVNIMAQKTRHIVTRHTRRNALKIVLRELRKEDKMHSGGEVWKYIKQQIKLGMIPHTLSVKTEYMFSIIEQIKKETNEQAQ